MNIGRLKIVQSLLTIPNYRFIPAHMFIWDQRVHTHILGHKPPRSHSQSEHQNKNQLMLQARGANMQKQQHIIFTVSFNPFVAIIYSDVLPISASYSYPS